mmetsp:Transcript_31710/g.42960  ORF Transcript_31710/g.42960 Transcript_31710/m.42960 type:complete len:234 (+) Transcript_31710:1234-1935(+)
MTLLRLRRFLTTCAFFLLVLCAEVGEGPRLNSLFGSVLNPRPYTPSHRQLPAHTATQRFRFRLSCHCKGVGLQLGARAVVLPKTDEAEVELALRPGRRSLLVWGLALITHPPRLLLTTPHAHVLPSVLPIRRVVELGPCKDQPRSVPISHLWSEHAVLWRSPRSGGGGLVIVVESSRRVVPYLLPGCPLLLPKEPRKPLREDASSEGLQFENRGSSSDEVGLPLPRHKDRSQA